MDDDRLVVGGDAVAEAAHEADQRGGRIGHAKVGPRREVEVPDDARRLAAAHAELADRPVGVVALVQDRHLPLTITINSSIRIARTL